MSYVIYNVNTTVIVESTTKVRNYKRERDAKAAMTRIKKSGLINEHDYKIADYSFFLKNIEKSELVTNIMTGEQVFESVNTPYSLSVASERYFSM